MHCTSLNIMKILITMPVFFQLINFVVLLIYFFFYMTQYNCLMNVTLSVCVLVSVS